VASKKKRGIVGHKSKRALTERVWLIGMSAGSSHFREIYSGEGEAHFTPTKKKLRRGTRIRCLRLSNHASGGGGLLLDPFYGKKRGARERSW